MPHHGIIDFALGNCVNFRAAPIGVLTQYKAQSLTRHVERSWGFLEASLGEYVDIVPAQQRHDETMVHRHRRRRLSEPRHPRESRPKYVVVLGGDHIYKMTTARC